MVRLATATSLLRVLADPCRVRLLALLEREQLTVAELVRITRLGQSRVSTHLKPLKEAGLVDVRRSGKSSFYAAAASPPAESAELWALVRGRADDPLLDEDARRLRRVLRARAGGGNWADSVAGRMERHYSPGRTWEAALRGLLGLARLGRALDVASGDCALAELIAPRARRVTCLDRSAAVLRAGAERLAHLDNVEFRRGDMHALPFADGAFDEVLLMACLCHAADPARAVAEAARVLRDGGALVATALHRHPHADAVERYGHEQLGFTPAELRRLCTSAGLDVAFCETTSRERRTPHFEVVTVHATK